MLLPFLVDQMLMYIFLMIILQMRFQLGKMSYFIPLSLLVVEMIIVRILFSFEKGKIVKEAL